MIQYGQFQYFSRGYKWRLAKKRVRRFGYERWKAQLRVAGARPLSPIRWIVTKDYEVWTNQGLTKCLAVAWKQAWSKQVAIT